MAILTTCCCYDNVWKGCFASAIYTLVFYSFSVASDISTVVQIHAHMNGEKMREEMLVELGFTTKSHMIFCIVNSIVSMGVVLATIVLLIGLNRNKREYLLPWIIGIIVDLCFGLVHMIFLVSTANSEVKSIMGALLLVYFGSVLLNIYCLLCVISQYQVYEEESRENMNVLFEADCQPRIYKMF